ncbi:hypothetical protein AB0L40_00030 [Patulibacter sp. NPDC049589]
MTIEPHQPPPPAGGPEDPGGDWPSPFALILIGVFLIAVTIAFVEMS